jgi:hypothetical protein
MTANVILPDAAAAAGALLVPASAVFEHQGGSAVWVLVAEGDLLKPLLRPVKVRQFREDGVLIADGLKPGERIAAAGVHKIVAGQPACHDGGRAGGRGAGVMRFNLSEWALRHQPLVRYLIVASPWWGCCPTRSSASRRIRPSPSR